MNPYVPLSVSSISFMYYSLFLNSFTFCLEEHGLSTPSSTAIVPLQKSGPRAALEGHSQLQHSLSLSLTCSLTRSKAAGNPPPGPLPPPTKLTHALSSTFARCGRPSQYVEIPASPRSLYELKGTKGEETEGAKRESR